MAEKTPQDDVLPLPKLKQMLALAEKEPKGCALALTKDKKDILLLIDKVAKPKKVSALLKKDAAGAFEPTTMRFGRVRIDVQNDPGTVRFEVNKSEAGGTMMHMVKLVKKAGYQACLFNEVSTLEQESEEEESEGTAAPVSQAQPVSPPPPPPGPVPQAEPPIDAAALKARLTALVQKIPAALAVDPTRKDSLLALAKQAQLMLGSNNLKAATQSTNDLEEALGKTPSAGPAPQAPASPANGTKPAGTVAYAKSRLAWLAARQRIGGEIAKLRAQLLAEYKDEPDGDEILDAYDTRVAPVLAALDEALADKLDEATNAEDAALRQQLIGDARALIGKYQKYLDGEKLIGDLDDNPFVPLTIRATMGSTLTALAAAIH